MNEQKQSLDFWMYHCQNAAKRADLEKEKYQKLCHMIYDNSRWDDTFKDRILKYMGDIETTTVKTKDDWDKAHPVPAQEDGPFIVRWIETGYIVDGPGCFRSGLTEGEARNLKGDYDSIWNACRYSLYGKEIEELNGSLEKAIQLCKDVLDNQVADCGCETEETGYVCDFHLRLIELKENTSEVHQL